jgi:twitching motility protein PilT
MNVEFSDILIEVIEAGASDLHLTVGAPPMVREKGKLRPLDYPKLTSQDTREIVYSILNNDQRKRLENEWQIDLSYSVPGRARFRVNAYFQRASIGAVMRTIPQDIPAFSTLGLPDILKDFTVKPRGFVLVTGPTGSGKSTTLASMIDMINETRHEHIMTVEDPIEFLHRHKNCVVNQRELGSDAQSFSLALKSALRQDPDVILVGEMRDLETMSTAITAAETGHLVFATLHTQDTSQTVDRIVDSFPPAQQHQVRTQLSIALQGIVTQQLLPTADGTGRICACEVLVPTPAVRNLIREGKTHQLYSALQTGGSHGMQTMDAALADLVRRGKITRQVAESRTSTPEEFKRLLENSGDETGAPLPAMTPALASTGATAPSGGIGRPGNGGNGGGIGGPANGIGRPPRGI